MSELANSPALVEISNDWVGELLSGNDTVNEAIAGVVAGLYFLFLLLSLFNFIRDKCLPHILLMFFCAIRIVCFSVRAYMQKHLSQNLAIVYEVFFAVGFVALVKLLVSLLTVWTLPVGVQPRKRGFSLGLLHNQGTIQERFITLSLMVGAVVTIVGATDAYNVTATVNEYNKGLTLMKAGYTIYLAVIVIFDLLVLTGPLLNRLNFGRPRSIKSATFLVLALEACGLLLTCKSVFQVIAIYTNPTLLFRNKLFYPLEVLPELLVLLIITFPGFIRHMLRGSHAYPEHDTPGGRKELNGATTTAPPTPAATTMAPAAPDVAGESEV